ncbi:hypothetical protein TrVE_jg2740 [Triparma verrucosa]|uniref:L-type lectin-like domain-containing protein n=2 Tax=Triparma TaxID=722752 RepID=A0A9W7ESK7_9STRA|nr:hypothetical protein TrST_g1863 [Triparma strigata]GMI15383.1 hypothetical protein TrVE_jg2740 [Triparma verrucosa]
MLRFLAFLSLFLLPVTSELLDNVSFSSPFTETDRNGQYMVPNFMMAGDADVKKTFVRLTPDRQSKRGTLWSKGVVGPYSEISATLTFRISGQGSKLFGDGIALWLTKSPRPTNGKLHGMDSKFEGIAVVIDTFKNVEHGSLHRDVTLLINDGTKDAEIGVEDVLGCNVDGMRYHEGRDDFSTFNLSRLRLLYNEDRLVVEVDGNGTNDWQTCATVGGLKKQLPKGFLSDARFGISGTTGQLADNHDIISLQVHSSHSEAKVASVEQHESFESADDLQVLVHDLEHQLTSIVEKLENTIGKLQNQEDMLEDRVKLLESTVLTGVESKMERRITNLEKQLDRKVQRTVNKAQKSTQDEIDNMKEFAEKNADSGGWRLPFMFLAVLVFVAGTAAYRHYRYLIKSHLL